jgi:hypothetical protein
MTEVENAIKSLKNWIDQVKELASLKIEYLKYHPLRDEKRNKK